MLYFLYASSGRLRVRLDPVNSHTFSCNRQLKHAAHNTDLEERFIKSTVSPCGRYMANNATRAAQHIVYFLIIIAISTGAINASRKAVTHRQRNSEIFFRVI